MTKTTITSVEHRPPRLVNLWNIIRSQPAIVPNIPKIAKGLYNLLSVKPSQKKSIGRLLEQQAQRYPDSPFLVDDTQQLSYHQANSTVNRLAHLLQQQGVGSGDVVALFLENRCELMLASLAALKLGAVATMLNTSQRQDVLLHSINITNPKLVVVGEELVSALEPIRNKLPEQLGDNLWYIPDNSRQPTPTGYRDLFKHAETQPDNNLAATREVCLHQPAFYVFTSGTTGMPKASIMSHYRWFKAMGGIGMASMYIRKDDVFYCALPLYHNNALSLTLSAVLGNGAQMVIARKFSATRFWDDIRKHKVTAFCYIGELCRYLYNQPAQPDDANNSLRVILGNGLRPDIWMPFKERFGIPHINEFYGASEVNLVFTNALNLDCTAGCCPLPHAIVKWDVETDKPVLDKRGRMQKVSTGETGLLLAKVTDKSPFDGYTSNDATEGKLLRNVFKNGDSYINTGDLVIKQGFMHIAFADRLGDTFRWKGENVATAEVESIINRYPGIEQAVVYGVDVPGADGKAGMAALTLDCTIAELSLQDLTSYLRNELPVYAVPLFIRIREQQKMTSTFKYQKVELKKESFDVDAVKEPILTLLPEEARYQPLTHDLLTQINSQQIRL
ncbi:long-chain-acyl-CoA synthetase [Parendozoicomonas haliclonae]|uniref:Long-chain-fatty-acid-CoA ligase FadD17 n=1 Tax=Parendozoicomonas haliclonae TaxID=1960125 RepID=A0A1X7AEB4_9GAMM|nr:long-chain-acyl-CoA synthetase [Parendozoicomonas haliclonae]SMA33885.1 Long-chain-fatty-acid-CoA ligase FadD17 [Parendozoicomonas haliclonae]